MTVSRVAHSAFTPRQRSCQSCHMPAVTDRRAIASVLGDTRDGLARHTFLGGNFFMLRMLNRYRDELGVAALPAELEATARATCGSLQTETATRRDRPRRAQRRAARGRRRGAQPDRPQAADRLSVAPRLAARLRCAIGRAGSCSSPARSTRRADPRQRQRRRRRAVRAALRRDPAADQVQIYESVMADPAARRPPGC